MNALVRPARLEDIPALVGLLKLLFSIEKDFAFDAAKQEQGLRLLLAANRAAILVAEQGRQVIGMCSGQLLISTAEGGLSVLVEDVAVLPAWQGKGVGKLLLTAIGTWAASCGASRLQLLADSNNAAALTFYQRVGWQTTELICLRTFIKESGNEGQD